MPLVESKRFLTKNLIVFAFLQFFVYMAFFYACYKTSEYLPANWWRILLFMAVLGAIFTSLCPAIARDNRKAIREGRERNYAYYCVVIPIAVYFVGYLFMSYYNWSIELSKIHLHYLSLTYIFGAPLSGFALAKLVED